MKPENKVTFYQTRHPGRCLRRPLCRTVLLSLSLSLSLILGACAADRVQDRRFGQQLVCHDGKETLAVSNADSFVHLDHGDALGPCPEPPDP